MTITHDYDQWGDETEDSMGDWDEIPPKKKRNDNLIED